MRAVNSGFTLIELLVVIGVLAVIAAGVVALINPQDKIMQANDAKVQNDVGQLGTAIQSFAAQNNGAYPTAAQGLTYLGSTGAGELSVVPVPPTANAAYGTAYGYGVTSGPDVAVVYGRVLSKKYVTAKCAGANA